VSKASSSYRKQKIHGIDHKKLRYNIPGYLELEAELTRNSEGRCPRKKLSRRPLCSRSCSAKGS